MVEQLDKNRDTRVLSFLNFVEIPSFFNFVKIMSRYWRGIVKPQSRHISRSSTPHGESEVFCQSRQELPWQISGERRLVEPQAVIERYRPRIPLHHLKVFPPAQVFDGHYVKPGLPEETGEGSPEHMGVTW